MINCEPLWVAGLMLRDVYVYFVIGSSQSGRFAGLPRFGDVYEIMDLPRYVSARPSSLFPAFAFLPSTGNSSCASSPPIAAGLGPPPSHRRKTRPYPFPRVPSSTAGGLGPLPSGRRRSQLYPFRASILRPSEDSALLLPTVGEFGAPPSARPLFHRRDTRRSPFRPSGDLTLPLPHVPYPTAGGLGHSLSDRRRIRLYPFRASPFPPPQDSTFSLPTAGGYGFPPFRASPPPSPENSTFPLSRATCTSVILTLRTRDLGTPASCGMKPVPSFSQRRMIAPP